MIPYKARIAAQDLRAAIHELNAIGTAESLSKLSQALGGGKIDNLPWSAPLQVAYVLALVVESVAAEEPSKVLNLHGVPLERLKPVPDEPGPEAA